MIDRRVFLQGVLAAATTPSLAVASRSGDLLVPDPNEVLDLPEGFSYQIVSRAGETMSDGLIVPPAHDGMAAFPGEDGRVLLVCNHEMPPSYPEYSAFGTKFNDLPDAIKERVYDHGGGTSPGAGGTTTTIYNPATGDTERQFLSLAGTELNCAGGPTPWGSWLSCEECFESPGTAYSGARQVTRDERHGYVFEVPADSDGLVEPVPIKWMGRFEHEACAVHEASGIVYLTEDRYYSLFYRFIPDVPGKLIEGGRLQALAIQGNPSVQTHNWSSATRIRGKSRLPGAVDRP